jgi:hypothetical protein
MEHPYLEWKIKSTEFISFHQRHVVDHMKQATAIDDSVMSEPSRGFK